MLGTNGGGFFGANSAHPFENPTPLTNMIQLGDFRDPRRLDCARSGRSRTQGWALFAAMSVLFLAGVTVLYASEQAGNPIVSKLGVDSTAGNMEGKEVRFGIAATALFATVTTDASCGAVNAMHDSLTPLGGLVPLINMQTGEVIFGGVGAGLYGMLLALWHSPFIAGPAGRSRTPEYLGKKIESKEVKMMLC